MIVVVAWLFATAFGRNYEVFANVVQGSDDLLLGIVRFVGNDGGRWRVGQQGVGTLQGMGVPPVSGEPGWIAECIDGAADFRAQPAATALDRFGPFFTPALC